MAQHRNKSERHQSPATAAALARVWTRVLLGLVGWKLGSLVLEERKRLDRQTLRDRLDRHEAAIRDPETPVDPRPALIDPSSPSVAARTPAQRSGQSPPAKLNRRLDGWVALASVGVALTAAAILRPLDATSWGLAGTGLLMATVGLAVTGRRRRALEP